MDKKDLLIITGMHRSGTSALAGMFAKAGAMLGDDLMPAAEDNPLGFWENNKAYFFHTGTADGKYPGGQYIRYDIRTEIADENYPKEVFSGWPPIMLSGKGEN